MRDPDTLPTREAMRAPHRGKFTPPRYVDRVNPYKVAAADVKGKAK